MASHKPTPTAALTPVGNTDPFRPSGDRPVRVRARVLPADTHFEPHHHGWAQLAYCSSGVLQVTAAQSADNRDVVSYIVPFSRAVWIAPGVRHAVNALEDAAFRTLYIHAHAVPDGWQTCRMLVMSPLLRELVQALDEVGARLAQLQSNPTPDQARESLIAALVLSELAHAPTQQLGVPLPHPQTGDNRLRVLCDAVMQAPARCATLAEWARDVGASERTIARLFRSELDTSFQHWRQQVVLARALPMLARGAPVGRVAAASGYTSDSAFTAMFRSAMGQAPSAFRR
jgi:AraC-like DNA-binding protein/quercetin dioxygenase-like cupin family protein